MPSLSTIMIKLWDRLLLTLKKAGVRNVQKSLVAKYTWMGRWLDTLANFFVFTGMLLISFQFFGVSDMVSLFVFSFAHSD